MGLGPRAFVHFVPPGRPLALFLSFLSLFVSFLAKIFLDMLILYQKWNLNGNSVGIISPGFINLKGYLADRIDQREFNSDDVSTAGQMGIISPGFINQKLGLFKYNKPRQGG